MKRVYQAPKMEFKEYAKFEAVFAQCTKEDSFKPKGMSSGFAPCGSGFRPGKKDSSKFFFGTNSSSLLGS